MQKQISVRIVAAAYHHKCIETLYEAIKRVNFIDKKVQSVRTAVMVELK